MSQTPCPCCGDRHTLEDTCIAPRAISREELMEEPIKPRPIFLIAESKEQTIQHHEASQPNTTAQSQPAAMTDTPASSEGELRHDAPTSKDTIEGPFYAESSEETPVIEQSSEEVPDALKLTLPAEVSAPALIVVALTRESGIGSFIGDYELIEKLGEGGMGQIFRARNARVGLDAAIKLLKPEVSSDDGVVRRFFQEARVVNEIHHENIIDILDLGRTQYGEYFLLMELLTGETLSQAMRSPFTKERLLHIALQLCEGLHACHQRGIAHRDFKSDNIFLITRSNKRDFVKILDFGLAKLYNTSFVPLEVSVAGIVVGTPICMSPEQACGEEIDHQTDIYAFGVLLYQMATGSLPFFDPNPMALLKMHLMVEPTPPSKRGSSLGKPFDAIVLRCLEKERKRRYQSLQEVSKALLQLRG